MSSLPVLWRWGRCALYSLILSANLATQEFSFDMNEIETFLKKNNVSYVQWKSIVRYMENFDKEIESMEIEWIFNISETIKPASIFSPLRTGCDTTNLCDINLLYAILSLLFILFHCLTRDATLHTFFVL